MPPPPPAQGSEDSEMNQMDKEDEQEGKEYQEDNEDQEDQNDHVWTDVFDSDVAHEIKIFTNCKKYLCHELKLIREFK